MQRDVSNITACVVHLRWYIGSRIVPGQPSGIGSHPSECEWHIGLRAGIQFLQAKDDVSKHGTSNVVMSQLKRQQTALLRSYQVFCDT